ncbi:MAG: hypothetical protein RLZZ65_413 [Bacteroidota bacterium]|jgi:hypothetical protein
MWKLICVSLVLWGTLFCACTSPTPPKAAVNFLNNKQLKNSQKIKQLLSEGHPDLNISKLELAKLYSFYKSSGFQPMHLDTAGFSPSGKKWHQSILRHEFFGIPAQRILFSKNQSLILQDVLLSYNIGVLTQDLDSGFINFETVQLKPKKWRQPDKNWFNNPKNTDSILLCRGPIDSNYRYFATHLYHFRDTAQLDTIAFLLTEEKEDKAKAWASLKNALISLNFINSTSDSLQIRQALKLFQSKHGLNPDGKIGVATTLCMKESSREKFERAMLNLDKLRQAPKRPENFVWVNIPSFELQFVAADTLRASHRIIVGKTDHPTPTLTSQISRIVSLPFWRVPSSIAQKEVLPALKRNPNYLGKEHMRIYRAKNVEVDPKKVNWKKIKENTFPYQIIQDPGPWNSLGLVKFEFANSFSVYVHDTPSRNLFKQNFRSFSHGCMRCELPIELGKTILTFDQRNKKLNPISADSLQTLIDQEIHQNIPLLKPLPIFVEYNTVCANLNGLYFYIDLYQKDKAYLALIRSKNNG